MLVVSDTHRSPDETWPVRSGFVALPRGSLDGNCPEPVESIHWNIFWPINMSLPTIFSTCRPRADVLAGTIRDDEFMADLSRVVNGTAPADYLDPAAFFAKSYPTRGMKELLKAVCLRLSGHGGEVSSIIRLGTQYGGGKTHSLIALVHAVRGMKGVPTPETFVEPAILPSGAIRIAALDGENADPANGLTLETKRSALEKTDPKLRPGKPPRWKRETHLLAWLDSL